MSTLGYLLGTKKLSKFDLYRDYVLPRFHERGCIPDFGRVIATPLRSRNKIAGSRLSSGKIVLCVSFATSDSKKAPEWVDVVPLNECALSNILDLAFSPDQSAVYSVSSNRVSICDIQSCSITGIDLDSRTSVRRLVPDIERPNEGFLFGRTGIYIFDARANGLVCAWTPDRGSVVGDFTYGTSSEKLFGAINTARSDMYMFDLRSLTRMRRICSPGWVDNVEATVTCVEVDPFMLYYGVYDSSGRVSLFNRTSLSSSSAVAIKSASFWENKKFFKRLSFSLDGKFMAVPSDGNGGVVDILSVPDLSSVAKVPLRKIRSASADPVNPVRAAYFENGLLCSCPSGLTYCSPLKNVKSEFALRVSEQAEPYEGCCPVSRLSRTIFVCRSCQSEKPHALCSYCAFACHSGHDVTEIGERSSISCDCSVSPQFRASRVIDCSRGRYSSHEEAGVPKNVYRPLQNFFGHFCYCGATYDETGGTMVQCASCEDWFHDVCAGAGDLDSLDGFDDSDLLYVCEDCLRSCLRFLEDYECEFPVGHIARRALRKSPTREHGRFSPLGCSCTKGRFLPKDFMLLICQCEMCILGRSSGQLPQPLSSRPLRPVVRSAFAARQSPAFTRSGLWSEEGQNAFASLPGVETALRGFLRQTIEMASREADDQRENNVSGDAARAAIQRFTRSFE